MKKNFYSKILVAIFITIAIIFIPKLAQANSFSASASKSSLKQGETATITVSTSCTGRFNITCVNGELSTDRLWLENSSGSVTITSTRSRNNSYCYTTKSTFYTKRGKS